DECLHGGLGQRDPLLFLCEQLVESPSVGMSHHRRRNQFAVLEVLVALRFAPAVASDHLARAEEDVARILHLAHTGFGGSTTGLEARRWARMKRRRSPTLHRSPRPILKNSGPVPVWRHHRTVLGDLRRISATSSSVRSSSS